MPTTVILLATVDWASVRQDLGDPKPLAGRAFVFHREGQRYRAIRLDQEGIRRYLAGSQSIMRDTVSDYFSDEPVRWRATFDTADELFAEMTREAEPRPPALWNWTASQLEYVGEAFLFPTPDAVARDIVAHYLGYDGVARVTAAMVPPREVRFNNGSTISFRGVNAEAAELLRGDAPESAGLKAIRDLVGQPPKSPAAAVAIPDPPAGLDQAGIKQWYLAEGIRVSFDAPTTATYPGLQALLDDPQRYEHTGAGVYVDRGPTPVAPPPKCECGAAATGIAPRAAGHSHWCPVK